MLNLAIIIGPEHPTTLSTLNNIACNMGYQGRINETVAVHMRLVDLQEKVLSLPKRSLCMALENEQCL